MSIHWGYVCRSHDPHLYSEQWPMTIEAVDWLYVHRDEFLKWFELTNYGPVKQPELEAPVNAHAIRQWLADHKNCAVRAVNENGDEAFLEDEEDFEFMDDGDNS